MKEDEINEDVSIEVRLLSLTNTSVAGLSDCRVLK